MAYTEGQIVELVEHFIEKMTATHTEIAAVSKQVTELYTLFCKNGYMHRFNQLADVVSVFLNKRAETCPIIKEVHEIKEELDEVKKELDDDHKVALARAEGKLRTREEDEKTTRRWKTGTIISIIALCVSVIAGIIGKALHWW